MKACLALGTRLAFLRRCAFEGNLGYLWDPGRRPVQSVAGAERAREGSLEGMDECLVPFVGLKKVAL